MGKIQDPTSAGASKGSQSGKIGRVNCRADHMIQALY